MMNQNREVWTPSITCITPGDLTVSYTSVKGTWAQSGSIARLSWGMTFVPTYTTAAGNLYITGLPTLVIPEQFWGGELRTTSAFTWPAGCSMVLPGAATTPAGATAISFFGYGTGIATAAVPITAFPSASNVTLTGSISVLVNV